MIYYSIFLFHLKFLNISNQIKIKIKKIFIKINKYIIILNNNIEIL